jgi:hypothetical protein
MVAIPLLKNVLISDRAQGTKVTVTVHPGIFEVKRCNRLN